MKIRQPRTQKSRPAGVAPRRHFWKENRPGVSESGPKLRGTKSNQNSIPAAVVKCREKIHAPGGCPAGVRASGVSAIAAGRGTLSLWRIIFFFYMAVVTSSLQRY